MSSEKRQIWIIDFGSQYTQLIARRLREFGISNEIMTWDNFNILEDKSPKAIILSGGPQSVYDDLNDYNSLFEMENIPILGICYGMQLIGKFHGGLIEKGESAEYGLSQISFSEVSIKNVPKVSKVWMSHHDHVKELPPNFKMIIESDNGFVAGILHNEKPILGLQFHPEVEHSEYGKEILEYFVKEMCDLKKDWSSEKIYEEIMNRVEEIKEENILCAFSGGVDSLVAATITAEKCKKNLYCFFVDHGLLRPQDYGHIEILKRDTDLNIEILSVKDVFFRKLKGETDPEKKRKIIGNTFIEVFEEKVKEFEQVRNIKFKYLLQGTLYTDVIESKSPHKKGGKSVTIKSHHNVGGLPERMNLKLFEPLDQIFKDEVRVLGERLNLKTEWVHRHPFPGPGIGIRILSDITDERVKKVQHSDQILLEELKSYKLYDEVWQAFTVLLPIKTVGVKGDDRAYEEVICLRIVQSTDGMTATWVPMPSDFLTTVSGRITNEVQGVTRVVYDITSKPPGTIEWE